MSEPQASVVGQPLEIELVDGSYFRGHFLWETQLYLCINQSQKLSDHTWAPAAGSGVLRIPRSRLALITEL